VSKKIELEELDRAIKNGEIRLCTVNTNIGSLTKEIEVLDALESELEENLKVLKKKNIVAIATEYKKAKEDLAKTKVRLISLKNDRENFKKAANDVQKAMEKAKQDIEKMKKNGDSNVLHGTFGRKDNG
jgi:chromosome segregation ATPase